MRILSIAIALFFLGSCANAEPLEQVECQRLDVHKIPANPKALLSEETEKYIKDIVESDDCPLCAARLTDLIYIDTMLSTVPIHGIIASHSMDSSDVYKIRKSIWTQIGGGKFEQVSDPKITELDHAKILYLSCQRVSILDWEECDPNLFEVFKGNSQNASEERRKRDLINAYNYAKQNWQTSQKLYRIDR